MKRQNLARRTIVAIFLVMVMAFPGLALAQGEPYKEGFDNGAPDWKLDGGWQAGDGFLAGRNQGSAIYTGADGWHDAHYHAAIPLLNGLANFTFMNTGELWYSVALRYEDGVLNAQLVYTALGQEFPTILGDSGPIQYGSSFVKLSGITLDVVVDGRAVDVSLNDKTYIHYESEEDLEAGTIGFEVLSESQIVIDEVSVDPANVVTETPPPSPTEVGQDLALTGMALSSVRQGSVIADIAVDVANLGDTTSQPTTLIVFDRENTDIRVEVPVEEIGPGGALTLVVSVEGPDEWANTVREFVAQLDPNNSLGETNTNNNELISGDLPLVITSGGGGIPAATEEAPVETAQPSAILPVALGVLGVLGLGVVGGSALVIRNQMQLGERRKLQKTAREGKPPEHCTPPGRYVEVEHEVELKLMKVTEIALHIVDPGTRSERREETIKDKLPDELNGAIRGRILREADERHEQRLAGLVKGLAKAIEREAYREKGVCDMHLSAHMEGIELSSTFTLYECKKTGAEGAWKKISSWEVKKTIERDDVLFGLEQLDTGATSMAMRLEALIGPLIKEYMKRY